MLNINESKIGTLSGNHVGIIGPRRVSLVDIVALEDGDPNTTGLLVEADYVESNSVNFLLTGIPTHCYDQNAMLIVNVYADDTMTDIIESEQAIVRVPGYMYGPLTATMRAIKWGMDHLGAAVFGEVAMNNIAADSRISDIEKTCIKAVFYDLYVKNMHHGSDYVVRVISRGVELENWIGVSAIGKMIAKLAFSNVALLAQIDHYQEAVDEAQASLNTAKAISSAVQQQISAAILAAGG